MIIFIVSIIGGLIFGLLVFMAIKFRKNLIPQLQTISRLKSLENPKNSNEKSNSKNRGSIFSEDRDLSKFNFIQLKIISIIDLIQKFFIRLVPDKLFQTLDRYIILSGKQESWSSNLIVFAWGMSIVIFLALGFIFISVSKLVLAQKIVVMILFGFIGAMLPLSFLRSTVKNRQEQIVLQLPPFLDLLSISVQAGLSFDAAVDRIVKRSEGPLVDEFRRMQRDLRLGISKRDSLKQMAERCDVEEVHLFTTSVIQAERLGTSMGKTLVDQANNMRDRYQQFVKAKALKAPIKMLFPLILFIFPTIFVVVLVPALFTLITNFDAVPGMGVMGK